MSNTFRIPDHREASHALEKPLATKTIGYYENGTLLYTLLLPASKTGPGGNCVTKNAFAFSLETAIL